MEENSNLDTLENELISLIDQSKNILSKVAHINISGISKFRNQVNREINFLTKIFNKKIFKKDHLCCSNLKHLEAVACQIIKNEATCIEIMGTRSLADENGIQKKLCIDLTLNGGQIWLKVVARNPKALTLVSSGEGYYGQKSIVEQAEEFVQLSQQHLHFYNYPKLVFHFAYGIENALAVELKEIGVLVEGNVIDSPENINYKTESNFMMAKSITNVDSVVASSKVNLCVSTMIAYVSALTNGGTNFKFESPILKEHAELERKRPVKPILDQLFKDRELFCCRTAEGNFRSILETLGGPGEKVRGENLLKRLTIVEDRIPNNLQPGGKIKLRSLAIFGTGESLKAVTATANHAFIRSSYHRGVNFVVFLHESRTLTEEAHTGGSVLLKLSTMPRQPFTLDEKFGIIGKLESGEANIWKNCAALKACFETAPLQAKI